MYLKKKTEHLARFCLVLKHQTEKHDLTHYDVFGSWIQYTPWELVRVHRRNFFCLEEFDNAYNMSPLL